MQQPCESEDNMLNYNKIRSMKPEEMAEWLCSIINDCDICPHDDQCWANHLGSLFWLTEEEWES